MEEKITVVPTSIDELYKNYNEFITKVVVKCLYSHNYALKYTDDIVQECYAYFCHSGFLEKYDPSKSNFKTYLHNCVKNVSINWTRYYCSISDNRKLSLIVDVEDTENVYNPIGILKSDILSSDDIIESREIFDIITKKLKEKDSKRGNYNTKLNYMNMFNWMMNSVPTETISKSCNVSRAAVVHYKKEIKEMISEFYDK
jgi:RNA polymerase sigma factor (sigma-70 family)